MGNRKIPEETKRKIVTLIQGNHSLDKISEITGVHRNTIFRIKSKLKLVKYRRKKFTFLNRSKVLAILRDVESIDRQLNSDDMERLAILHDVSVTSLIRVIKRGLDAVSSKRHHVKPSEIQTIYRLLEKGERISEIQEKTGIPRTTLNYYKIRYDHGKDIRTCAAPDCENTFIPRLDGKPKLYCSTRCRDREKQRRYRALRKKNKLCPQCGKDWVEPMQTHRGKPKHCRNCQAYFNERYEKSHEGF